MTAVVVVVSGVLLGVLLDRTVRRWAHRLGYVRGLRAGRAHAEQRPEAAQRVWSLAERAAAFNEPVRQRRRSPDHQLVARSITPTNERAPLPH